MAKLFCSGKNCGTAPTIECEECGEYFCDDHSVITDMGETLCDNCNYELNDEDEEEENEEGEENEPKN